MLILVLDSSTDVVTAAVAHAEVSTERRTEREVLAEVSVASRSASETLLPAAHSALGLAGTDLGEVEHILVGIGPGTFTGIRIGLAAARALSLAIGATLSGNSTLAAVAAPALLSTKEPNILAVLDARRHQVFAQCFVGAGAHGGHGGVLCATPNEVSAELPTKNELLIVGHGAMRYRSVFSRLGCVPPDASPLHRVGAAGHVLSADLKPVPAREVVPLYVREPDAEVRKDFNPWSRA